MLRLGEAAETQAPATTGSVPILQGPPDAVVADPAPQPVARSVDEAQWLNSLATLHRRLSRALERAGREAAEDEPEVDDAAEALAEIGRCLPTVRAELERAPRLFRAAARLLPQACEAFAAGASIGAESFLRDPDGRGRAFEAWSRGARLLAESNELQPDPRDPIFLPLPSVPAPVPYSHLDPRIADIAADVFNLHLDVRCWSERDWPAVAGETEDDFELAGIARLGSHVVSLAPWVCDEVGRILYGGEQPTGDDLGFAAAAVVILTHEFRHFREGTNEAVVECTAVQRARDVAVALGTDEDYAELLTSHYWANEYPHLPREYRSPECREGGSLDRDPERKVFP